MKIPAWLTEQQKNDMAAMYAQGAYAARMYSGVRYRPIYCCCLDTMTLSARAVIPASL